MSARRLIIILVGLSCLLPDSTAGQTLSSHKVLGRHQQHVWQDRHGLPGNPVSAITRTRDGYLWLGTFGGLARFDGVRFTIFNSGNTPGLKSNRILSLCEDGDGTLWLGTETGEVMSFRDGEGQTYTTSDGLPGGYVWAIKKDRAGTLWVGTRNGLAWFEDGRFTAYTSRDGLPDDQIWAMDEDEEGRLWVATDGGLVQFESGKFTAYWPQEGMLEGSFVPFCVRRGGGYWVGTSNGLAHFSDGKFIPHANPAGSSAWQMRTIMEDREGTLWVSYFSPSLLCRFQNGRFSFYELKSGRDGPRLGGIRDAADGLLLAPAAGRVYFQSDCG